MLPLGFLLLLWSLHAALHSPALFAGRHASAQHSHALHGQLARHPQAGTCASVLSAFWVYPEAVLDSAKALAILTQQSNPCSQVRSSTSVHGIPEQHLLLSCYIKRSILHFARHQQAVARGWKIASTMLNKLPQCSPLSLGLPQCNNPKERGCGALSCY